MVYVYSAGIDRGVNTVDPSSEILKRRDWYELRSEVSSTATLQSLVLSCGSEVFVSQGAARRARRDHSPLIINGSSVEIIKNTKFLAVHLVENLTWTLNTSSITKRAQQRLYFLRKLKKAHLPSPILTTFYRGTIDSTLSSCITTCFGKCTVIDHKTLQGTVRTADKITGVSLSSITDIYTTRCIRKATSIMGDPTHPSPFCHLEK
ncbi:hypothetical protein P4O66_005326, partial [Electrophorus voltai]